jgi:hypothetical protein
MQALSYTYTHSLYPLRRIGPPAGSAYYFFFIVIVIRDETPAAARWALLLIVRTLFNDAITVAVWTGFHVCLPGEVRATICRPPAINGSKNDTLRGI